MKPYKLRRWILSPSDSFWHYHKESFAVRSEAEAFASTLPSSEGWEVSIF